MIDFSISHLKTFHGVILVLGTAFGSGNTS